VLWLIDKGIDITCIKVTPYKDEDKLYLDVEQILPTQDIGDYQIRWATKKQEETATAKEEATRYKLRYRFWEKALPVVRTKTDVFNNISPSKDNWLTGVSGHSGIVYCLKINMHGARAELRIESTDKDWNEKIFNKLYKTKKQEAESAFGGELDWQELPDKKVCHISVHYDEYGLNDYEKHWGEIANFLADNVAKLISTFKPLLDAVVKNIVY